MTRFTSILAMGAIAIACIATTKPLAAQTTLEEHLIDRTRGLQRGLQNPPYSVKLLRGFFVLEQLDGTFTSMDLNFNYERPPFGLVLKKKFGENINNAVCKNFGEITITQIDDCIANTFSSIPLASEQNSSTDSNKRGYKGADYGTFYYPSPPCADPVFYGTGFGYIQYCGVASVPPVLAGYYYFSYANPSQHFAFTPYP